MANKSFEFAGEINNEMLTDNPVVRSIAWCPYPKKYVSYATDVIAVCGNFGTAVHCRRRQIHGKTIESTIDEEGHWDVWHRETDIMGETCLWNPSGDIEAGSLAILTSATGDSGVHGAVSARIYVVDYNKNIQYKTRNMVYQASWDNEWSISSVCWCSDGKSMLIFTDSSSIIRYIVWNNDAKNWNRAASVSYSNDNLARTLFGCVPPNKEMFAAAGPTSQIKIFTKAEPLEDDLVHEPYGEVCSWGNIVTVQSMSFSKTGEILATLSMNGVVNLFRISFPRVQAALAGNPSRIYFEPDDRFRINFIHGIQRGFPFRYLSWCGEHVLIISGDRMSRTLVVQFRQYGRSDRDSFDIHDALGKGKNSITPYNAVNNICICPERSEIFAIVGYENCISFWQRGKYFKRGKFNLFLRKYPSHMCQMVKQLAVFQGEYGEQLKTLNDLLTAQLKLLSSIEERWRNVGKELARLLEELYDGRQHMDLLEVLEYLYSVGRYSDDF